MPPLLLDLSSIAGWVLLVGVRERLSRLVLFWMRRGEGTAAAAAAAAAVVVTVVWSVRAIGVGSCEVWAGWYVAVGIADGVLEEEGG